MSNRFKRRLDGVCHQTRATVVSEYACRPVRFLSVLIALVVGLGVLAFFGPISAQFDRVVNHQNNLTPVAETPQPASGFISVSEIAVRSSQPNEYFKGNYEVVSAEDVVKVEKPRIEADKTEVKLIKEVGAEDRTKDISVSTNNDFLTIELKDRGLTAGAYKVETIQKDTGKVLNDQKVLWGVLAFNPDYAIYPVGRDAFFSLAVLDDRGKMVCTAAITVEITDPTNKITTLTTADGTVRVNKDCEVYGKTDNPDYQANFKPSVEGNYRVKIVARAGEGIRTLHDQFSVKDNQDFYLQRVGATRTYPPIDYDYTLNFEAKKAGQYTLTEKVPSSFEIKNTDGNVKTDEDSSTSIVWRVDAKAGQIYPLKYVFKTPNISPYLFELGSVNVTSSDDEWQEPRSWLIASDSACQSATTGNWSNSASWTSCGGTVPQAADTVQILNTHNITEDTASVTVAGVTIDNGGTLTVSTTNSITVSGNWSNSGTFTAASGTVIFSATATGKTLSGTMTGSSAFYDLTFNGSGGGWTLSANAEASNDFTVTLGTFSTSGTNYSLTVGRDFTIANSGSATFTANGSTITVGRHWNKGNSGNFSRGSSTVNLTGTGELQSTGSGFTQFYNLGVASSSQTTTMAISRTDVFNTLTINEGTMTCSVTCEYELFRTSGTDLSINASATLSGSNATFQFRKQSASTISLASGNYGTWHLLLRADTTGIVTFNMTGSITTTGTVLVWAASGGTGSNFNTQNYNLSAKSFSVGHSSNTTAIASNFGSSTVTLENGTSNTLFPVSNGGSHTLNLSSSSVNVKGNVLFVNGTGTFTITPGSSTLTWTNTSGTLTFSPNSQSLYNLTLNGSGGTVTPSGTVSITNDLTITLGTFDTTTSNYAVNVTRDVLIANSASATLRARGSTITVSRHWSKGSSGVFTRDSSTVQLNGDGEIQTVGGGQTQFEHLVVAYSGKTTTMATSTTHMFGTLTVNEGTLTCSVTCTFQLFRTSGADLSINASATLTGSNATFHLRKQSASTVTIAGATNYGTWNILAEADTTGIVTFNVGGAITTSGYLWVRANTGGTGSNFNTQNYAVSAKYFLLGDATDNTAIAANFGSSTTTFDNGTGDGFYVASNGGAHTLNLSTSSTTVTGNVKFGNRTGTITVDDGSSTFTFAPSAGTATYSPDGETLYNVIVNGAATVSPDGAVIIANDLTMTAGTLSGTQNLTVSGGDITGNGTINLTGGTTTLTGSGNFGGNTAWTFYNLTFGNASSGGDTTTGTGSGAVTVSNILTINKKSGIFCVVNTLNGGAKTWTLSGTTGSPLVASGDFSPDTSTIIFTGNYGSGDTNVPGSGAACGNVIYNNLTLNSNLETFAVSGTADITINGDLTISAGTFTAGSGTTIVGGNVSNSGTFTANSGTVELSGSSTQTLSGTLTGGSAFYNLIISNSSGAVSGCATSFTPGVDFAVAATISNLYTITTANVKVEYNSGSTYAVNDINWDGGGTSIYFRNSNLSSGTWLLNVTAVGNAQDKVSYVDVGRSDASGGATIIASDGTNTDCSNNTNWQFDETLTLSLDSTSKDFGVVTPGSNPSDQTSTLTATSNAVNGYVIYAWSTQAMTNTRFGGVTIADWTGTNTAPTAFDPGNYGFGYNTDDTSLTGGTADRFGSGPGVKFAGFTHSGPGDPVADRTAPATSATNTISYRLYPSTTQADGDYTTIIVYVIAAQFP